MMFRRGKMAVAAILGSFALGAWAHGAQDASRLALRSASALVQDQRTGEVLVQKQTDTAQPIASITKLMTAMVVLDARQDMQEPITILEEDKDQLRHSRSRLPVGTVLTRGEGAAAGADGLGEPGRPRPGPRPIPGACPPSSPP